MGAVSCKVGERKLGENVRCLEALERFSRAMLQGRRMI